MHTASLKLLCCFEIIFAQIDLQILLNNFTDYFETGVIQFFISCLSYLVRTLIILEQKYIINLFKQAFSEIIKSKIKSSLYSPYYTAACNELRGPSPRLTTWATQLRRNVATVASRWRHCVDLTSPGIEPQTFRTASVHLATELTAGFSEIITIINQFLLCCKKFCTFTLFFSTIYEQTTLQVC